MNAEALAAAAQICERRASSTSNHEVIYVLKDTAQEIRELATPPHRVSEARVMELWNECCDEAGSNIVKFAYALIQESRKEPT